METYVKQSKPAARTLSARTGHGQSDMAAVLQAYRNRTAQLAALTDKDDQALQGKFTVQLQEEGTLQEKFVTQLQGGDEEELLQQKTENRTGLPDELKSGVENLSGYSLDGVKVHYNSPKPAQLQALAYTQGTDIHVGPGQERYLGHEAWHVVQQMQGRVQPTTQLQGIAVNYNEGLEREADVMGGKITNENDDTSGDYCQGNCSGDLIQRVSDVQNTTQQLPFIDLTGTPGNQLAGLTMEAWLDPVDPLCGSAPGVGANYPLYSLLNLFSPFVKGHLLNANLGGPGVPENLFPLTVAANNSQSALVEEPVKAGLLSLSRNLGILANGTGFGGVGAADRVHYMVAATWLNAGTGDFLANPQSQLECYAEFIDIAGNMVSPIADTVILSDPGHAAANTQNADLNNIGWGSMGIGNRTAPNNFTTYITGALTAAGLPQYTINGPQWDNQNNLVGQKVYITIM